MSEQKKRKQINFDIRPELHTAIKIQAIKKNMSMNLWITRAIYEQLKREKNERIKIED